MREEIKKNTTDRCQEMWELFLKTTSEGIAIFDKDMRLVLLNNAATKILGTTEEDIGKTMLEITPTLKNSDQYKKYLEVLKTGKPQLLEDVLLEQEFGKVLLSVNCFKVGDGLGIIYNDITEKALKREQMNHLNLVLRAIRNVNQLITQEKDRRKLIKGACQALTEADGYHNVWIALIDESKDLVMVEESGLDEKLLSLKKKLKSGKSISCVQKALKQSGVQKIENPKSSCIGCPLSKDYKNRGGVAVRLEHEGKVFGIICASTNLKFLNNKEELELFAEVASDISFALYSIDLEKEREKTVKKLARSRNEILTTLNSIGDAVISTDSKGNVTFMNPIAEDLTGWKENESVGKKIKEIFHIVNEETGAEVENPVAKVIKEGAIVGLANHTILIAKNGSRIPIADSGAPIKDEDGTIFGVVLVFRDISERKKAEKVIQQKTHELTQIIDLSLDFIGFAGFDAYFKRINPTFSKILGYTEEEILSKPFLEFVHPDDREATLAEVGKLSEGATTLGFTNRYRCKDGSYRWLEWRSTPVVEEDGMTFVARDITEQKKTDEVLRESERKKTIRNRIANIFLMVSEEDEMYNEVLNVLLDVLNSEHGIFGFIDENGALVIPSMTRHIWDKCQVPDKRIIFPRDTWGEGSWCRAIRAKKTIYKNEPSTITPKGHITINRHIDMPIIHLGEVIGLFQVANKLTDYNEEDIRILNDIANQVAPILNAKLQRNSEEQERKQAQEQLASSEEFLNSIIRNLPISMWISDSEGTHIKQNQACRELFGVTDEEAIGKYNLFKDNVIEEQGFMPLVENVFEKGEIARFTLDYDLQRVGHVKVKGATHRILDVIISPIKDIHGKVTNAIIQHIDITERKQMEEELRKSEDKYRIFTESSSSAISLFDEKGTYLFINDIALQWIEGMELNLKIDDIIDKKTVYDIFPKDTADFFLKRFQRIIKSGVNEIIEERVEELDRWITTELKLVRDKKDKFLGLMTVTTDITDSKKAEEKLQESEALFRSIFESNMIGTLLWDANGDITDSNDVFLQMVGYSKDDILSGIIRWRDMTPPEYKDQDDKALEEIAATGVMSPIEKEYIRKDGSRFPVLLGAASLPGDAMNGVAFVLDITERKRVEEKLKNYSEQLEEMVEKRTNELQEAQKDLLVSEQRLRDVIDNAKGWVWEVDSSGKYTYCSPLSFEIFGYKPEDMIGKHFYDFFIPENREELKKAVLEVYSRKEPFKEFINQYVHKNGKIIWISTSSVPLLDEKGNLIGYRGVDTDITERKKAEEVLLRMASIIETSDDAIISKTIDGTITSWNPGAERIFGYSAKEIVGQPNSILVPPDRIDDFPEIIERLKRGEKIENYETIRKTKNGEYLDISLTISPLKNEKGEIIGVSKIARNITESKKAERALRESERKLNIRNQIDKIYLTVSEEDEIYNEVLNVLLDVMNSEFGVFGYIDENGAFVVPSMTRHIWDKCQVTDKRFTFPRDTWGEGSWCRAIREKKTIYTNEPATLTPKGHITIDRHISMPLIYMGDVVGLFQIANKATDYKEEDIRVLSDIANHVAPILNATLKRKIVEQELNDANEQLIRKEKLAVLGRLSGAIGHELRNPLGAIKNAAYFLNMVLEDVEPEVKESLEILEKEVNRSDKIISNILSFARPKPIVSRKTNLTDVIKEALTNVVIPNNIKLMSKLEESLPIIRADPDLLAQVFTNVILNGIQAMREGGKLIIDSSSAEQDWVTISITDTGSGIPDEVLEKLFEPLFTTKAKGIGLGLAITKDIVEKHGGSVDIQSKVGKGTTFTIKLPVKSKV